MIADVDIKDTPDRLWTIVSFTLVGVEASPAPIWALLATRKGLADDHRMVQGARVLHRLAEATGTSPEAIKDPFELPDLFVGKPVDPKVVHETRDGIPELVVHSFRQR